MLELGAPLFVEKKLKIMFHIQKRIQERDLPLTQVYYPNAIVRELRVCLFRESFLTTSLLHVFPFLVGYVIMMKRIRENIGDFLLIDVKSP